VLEPYNRIQLIWRKIVAMLDTDCFKSGSDSSPIISEIVDEWIAGKNDA
jgi:hypothetical protein